MSITEDEVITEQEIGAGLPSSSFSGVIIQDYNPDLIGVRAIQTYDRMRKGDASVRASLRVIKAPLLAGQWYFEPASDSDEDRMVADFITWAWDHMSRTGTQVLWEALLMLDFGYYAFEKVFKLDAWRPGHDRAREKDVITWKKWGPRHPLNTSGWVFDGHGGVQAIKQNSDPSGFKEVTIPIEKMVIFTNDEEAGNPEGISILRSAYQNWYYKQNLYKVDAIQKERHGIGIPSTELPQNATANDKKLAREMVRNLRTNEKAGIVRPFGWVIDFIEPKGNQVDVLASAQHHDQMIMANVLATFLSNTRGTGVDSTAQEDIFIKSIHYVADLVCATINKWAIPELVNLNFDGVSEYPQMRVRRIGDLTDLRAFSVALRNFVESNVVTPDSNLEEWLRDYTDLPIASQEAVDRSVAERTAKSPAQKTGAAVAQRVPLPTDGA